MTTIGVQNVETGRYITIVGLGFEGMEKLQEDEVYVTKSEEGDVILVSNQESKTALRGILKRYLEELEKNQ